MSEQERLSLVVVSFLLFSNVPQAAGSVAFRQINMGGSLLCASFLFCPPTPHPRGEGEAGGREESGGRSGREHPKTTNIS